MNLLPRLYVIMAFRYSFFSIFPDVAVTSLKRHGVLLSHHAFCDSWDNHVLWAPSRFYAVCVLIWLVVLLWFCIVSFCSRLYCIV